MPHSKYAVSDRKAVAQLKYQARRFVKQMKACGTDPADVLRISRLLDRALLEAAGSVDFHDGGSGMEDA